ncbi:2Fe-2S iron-sulfur cluster binding domain protein [Paecilomyces variotii No. 5]|uniref:2Fe-2S iron-sulfur cluster binding domain protein n=2 Tax=Paecilomyces TaxID=33202 RepID=V5FZ48_BYSSN|nr:2Fe-2S iron-sulfur cluster binding domain protein [Paecilomyces variotii No. 5]
MPLWREASLQLRYAASKAAAGDRICLAHSRRFLSSSVTRRGVQNAGQNISIRRSIHIWNGLRSQGQSHSAALARRRFSATAGQAHGHITPPKPGEEINVTFIDKDGEKYDFQVSEGDNLLDIAQANDLEMEGACGGSCACSTCHVIVEDPDMYDKMPEPDDDENDMLDLAFGLTETSRLGCQVKMNKELDGLVVRLPSMTRNLQASDFEDKKK